MHDNICTSIMTDHLSREALISKASDLKVIPTLNGIMEKVLQVLGNNNSSLEIVLEELHAGILGYASLMKKFMSDNVKLSRYARQL